MTEDGGTRTARARTLRRHATPAERLLWARLRDRRLSGLKFRRQRPIGPYVVDFVCLDHLLIVELDGAPHELTYERDAIRDARLEASGYRVLRFPNDEVRRNLDGVCHAILNALGMGEEPSPGNACVSASPTSGRGGRDG